MIVQGSDSHPVMEGIMVDITERKALETQLQQSRKMEAVGRLAGGIAHDFNNLLTIISGYTELALSRPHLPHEVRGDIERIENASGRAAGLVRQLLAFSRKQVLQPKILDLNKIVLNLDTLLRRLMDEHIEMVTRVRENIGKVKADPAQIEQVIMNLVVNARDAMPDGGRLVVETCDTELDVNYAVDHITVKPGRYVMLAVSDTGVGMDKQTVAHIFEPFFTTKESGRGTGLGLSTVYGIVKQSGGYIWVYSEPGKGSTFKVYLPRVDDQPEDIAGVQSALGKPSAKETILVVEDEEAVRELIQTVLTEKGYEVIAAPGSAARRAGRGAIQGRNSPAADGHGDARNQRARTGHAHFRAAPRYSRPLYVGLHGQRNHRGRHAGKRPGVSAEALFTGRAGAKSTRSAQPHDGAVDFFLAQVRPLPSPKRSRRRALQCEILDFIADSRGQVPAWLLRVWLPRALRLLAFQWC